MKKPVLGKAAVADLEAIFDYGLERFGADVAERYLRGFDSAIAMIADHPRIGSVHETVRPPIRSLPHGSHRIYHDVVDSQVVVRRVLHKAMDVARWL